MPTPLQEVSPSWKRRHVGGHVQASERKRSSGRHACHGPQPSRCRRRGRAVRRGRRHHPSRSRRIQGRAVASRREAALGTGTQVRPTRTQCPTARRRRSDGTGRLRCVGTRRPLDRALALSRSRRRRAVAARADRQPIPRQRTRRGLPTRAVAEGTADAARQPSGRRRRGARQDRRSRSDHDRVAAATTHSTSACADACIATSTVARGALGQILPSLRGGRPPEHGPTAATPWHGRQSVAFVQPHRGLVPLPAPTGRPRAVPRRLSRPRRVAASTVGSADRRRVPQPHALAFRRRQRALPDAAPGCTSVRAPPVPFGHAAQRPYALLHRLARDAGSPCGSRGPAR